MASNPVGIVNSSVTSWVHILRVHTGRKTFTEILCVRRTTAAPFWTQPPGGFQVGLPGASVVYGLYGGLKGRPTGPEPDVAFSAKRLKTWHFQAVEFKTPVSRLIETYRTLLSSDALAATKSSTAATALSAK